MPTAVKIVLVAAGAVLLLVALLGDQVVIRGNRLPSTGPTRFVITGLGIILLAVGAALFAFTPHQSTAQSRNQALLNKIPSDIRDSCRASQDLPEKSSAYVKCDTTATQEDPVEHVDYVQFSDLQAAEKYYGNLPASGGTDWQGSSNCSTDYDFEHGAKGEWTNGRYSCYAHEGLYTVDWLNNEAMIVGVATEQHPEHVLNMLDWVLRHVEVGSPPSPSSAADENDR